VEDTVPSLIASAEQGDRSAAEELFAALYAELHRLARRELARVGGAAGVGTTSLLHEAYLDLAARTCPAFPDEGRFMAYAARAMRGLIIDHARSRRAMKRGGQFEITSLGDKPMEDAVDERELTQVSDALDELAQTDPSLVEVVDLKFFSRFSFTEIAAMQGVSERTVRRQWEKARIYLHRSISTSLSL
jgi:RNA polymerase sigma factor (TIGR02999 family)